MWDTWAVNMDMYAWAVKVQVNQGFGLPRLILATHPQLKALDHQPWVAVHP